MILNVKVLKVFFSLLIFVSVLPLGGFSQPTVSGTFLADRRTVATATSDKPQSKAWYHDGRWWCALADGDTLSVYRLDETDWLQHLVLAPSTSQRADCFSDGEDAFILAHTARGSTLHKISYQDGQYGLGTGWDTPVELPISRSSETATIARDTTGRLWIGTEYLRKIEVYYSDVSGREWAGPVIMSETITDDDICAIAALPAGDIGVMWSDQNLKEFGFAVHKADEAPETWSKESVRAEGPFADDHINLAVASDGTLYAAVKTEYDATGMPQLGVLRRKPDGEWSALAPITVLSSTESGTRPIVLLNEERREVYAIYTNWAVSPNTISVKTASTTDLVFPEESVPVMVQNYNLNNVTSTRQTVTQDSGVLLLAAPASGGAVHYCLIRDFNLLHAHLGIAEWNR